MIGYLRGRVLECAEGKLLLAVGQSDGESVVGYQLHTPQTSAYFGLHPGSVAELFVYAHVREDVLDLYGFLTRPEKELYLTLLSVTGIGPKGALGILSGAEPQALVQAILDHDRDFLTRVPGVGKKTAERVVLELADPLRKRIDAGLFPLGPKVASSSREDAASAGALGRRSMGTGAESGIVRDAKAALVSLGYREQDISTLLNRVLTESETPPKRAEDLIRSALRQLA